MDDDELKSDIGNRLSRIEGQVRGIRRMIDNDEGCVGIMVQVAAVRSAINTVGGIILKNYTKNCIRNSAASGDEETLDELIDTIIRFTK